VTNAKALKVNKKLFSIEYYEASGLKPFAQVEAKLWL